MSSCARGAFPKADAAPAAATLAAYAVGLIPFVLIRSAVATFYARKDTATPVKASLTGLTINMGLKLLLMGEFAAGARLCGACRLPRIQPAVRAVAAAIRREWRGACCGALVRRPVCCI